MMNLICRMRGHDWVTESGVMNLGYDRRHYTYNRCMRCTETTERVWGDWLPRPVPVAGPHATT